MMTQHTNTSLHTSPIEQLQVKTMSTKFRLFASTALLSSFVLVGMQSTGVAANSTSKLIVGENTERVEANNPLGDIPFSISVDGEPVDGSPAPVDLQRDTDIELEKVDIQVKFDGLDSTPILNVSTDPISRTLIAGKEMYFRASWNYPDWIERAEVRILKNRDGVQGAPLRVIPVSTDSGYGVWVPDTAVGEDGLSYVLRVYDKKGRFDETKPLPVLVSSEDVLPHETNGDSVAPGEGQDRTGVRNIPVYGGSVTVYGENVPEGYKVGVLGRRIEVDGEQRFVAQRILPPGDHNVDVTVSGEEDDALSFDRKINIPSNDWFYVALADLTVGRKFRSSNIVPVAGENFDRTYTKGRLAFYLKGKIQGKYLLTAAADTKESEIKDIFRGFDRKDPRQLLRRIDPNAYYPVYGDGSSTVEDAPTSGKFYVRLERGESHVMWGNFKTRISGSEFIRSERTLYGASAVYKSEKSTTFGESKVQTTLYAAQPGTLPKRDAFRGTGGSAYFLKRQDISTGSEQISIEVRDRITGRVLSRKLLRYGEDYDINYVQGVIILRQPLSSTADTGSIVGNGSLDGASVYLVANYEYTPAAAEIDGYIYGGRSQVWANDKVRIGLTGVQETTGTADQKLFGADIQIRKSEKTFIEAEIARSEGPGFGNSLSTDGGFLFENEATTGVRGRAANAYRVRGQVDLADLGSFGMMGTLTGHFEEREAGFSSQNIQANTRQTIWGFGAEVELNQKTKLKARYDDYVAAGESHKRDGELNVVRVLNERFDLGLGVRHSDYQKSIVLPGKVDQNGRRTDVGVRLTYKPNEKDEYHVFGQVTLDRSGDRYENNRAGVGTKVQLTDKIDVSGEVSYGNTGMGVLAALGYSPTADDRYYFGYRLDPERAYGSTLTNLVGSDRGALVFGTRRKINEYTSAFLEHNYDLYGERQAISETYGVKYTPDSKWSFEGTIENGRLEDPGASDFYRIAFGLGGSYKTETASARARIEARFEDSEDNTRDRNTWLFSAGSTLQTSPDWTLSGDLDMVISQSQTSDFLDGDYVKGSLGYAYRPVDNDKLNALFKYTFLYDLPGVQQVSANGTLGPLQRSHIVSADVSYDLTEKLTIGAKYGARFGEYALDRANPDWQGGSAHIAILRADYHVVKNWDVLIEGRVLHTPDIDSTQFGALVGVYRHVGDNFKVGVGYNFGRFSDDLTDLTQDDHGVFVNVVGKF